MTKCKNKIAVMIAWPREINVYEYLFKKKYASIFDFIVNDTKSFEKGRNKTNLLIQEILKKKNIKFKLFSKVFKKYKYKALISTGEINALKINFYSIVKFLYANTIGIFIKFTKIDKILINIFGRPFTGGSTDYKKIGTNWYPEKEIANKVIKYPDGADLKLKNYPYKFYENIFDIFFSFSELDLSLVKKKFNNIICKKIDYFRYKKKLTFKKKKKFISNFNFISKKPLIVWLPTHIETPLEEDRNIIDWIKKISNLQKRFNLIIRPHPKTLSRSGSIIKTLESNNLKIDQEFDRNLGNLINSADLILADYGGMVFDSIYLKKRVVLLNMFQDSKYVSELKLSDSIDIKFRKKFICINLNHSQKIFEKKISNAFSSAYKKQIRNIRNIVFGESKKINLVQMISFLKNL